MTIRQLNEQFENVTAERIRRLIRRFQSMEYPVGVSRYYSNELQTTLEAGALLAALCLTASLLEIVVRELILQHTRPVARPHLDLQADLEAQKRLTFAALVDALANAKLLNRQDAEAAKSFYGTIRIPVLHGLPRRFVKLHQDEGWTDLRQLIRLGSPVMIHELEDVLEDNALRHIETVAGIFERNLQSQKIK